MVEQNAIWVSHMTRLIRVAPEHVRLLSNHEQLVARSIQELGSSPIQGSGVFQYIRICLNSQVKDQPNPFRTQVLTVHRSDSRTLRLLAISPSQPKERDQGQLR